MTNSFGEFDRAKMFFVIGSNMTEAHPVAATFLKNAVQKGASLVVADPRKHKLVDFADIHLPLKVGSDIALLNGLMHVLIKEDLYDKDFVEQHTEDFDKLVQVVEAYPPERAEEISGIPADTIIDTARKLSLGKACHGLLYLRHYRAYLRPEQRGFRGQPPDAFRQYGGWSAAG